MQQPARFIGVFCFGEREHDNGGGRGQPHDGVPSCLPELFELPEDDVEVLNVVDAADVVDYLNGREWQAADSVARVAGAARLSSEPGRFGIPYCLIEFPLVCPSGDEARLIEARANVLSIPALDSWAGDREGMWYALEENPGDEAAGFFWDFDGVANQPTGCATN